jgi:alkaline phosphatase D
MRIEFKMLSLAVFSSTALLLQTAAASFDGNLNYASPSRRHGGLGIDIPRVERRSWKRDNVEYDPSELSFTHGVASGDPWPDSVILWTRVAPSNVSSESNAPVDGTAPLYSHETEQFVMADPNPICVGWTVFQDQGGNASQAVVASGEAYTTSDIDYTVKVSGRLP